MVIYHKSNLYLYFEELGVQLVKQAAIKTAEGAGDGTTTSTLLAQEMVKGIRPITSVEVKESEMELAECESGYCPVK